jgi:hypothetical protein
MIVTPKAFDFLLLTNNHVGIRVTLSQVGESGQSGLAPGLEQHNFADQDHSLKPACPTATSVEGPAIERTYQTIVANYSGHHDGMNGPFG